MSVVELSRMVTLTDVGGVLGNEEINLPEPTNTQESRAAIDQHRARFDDTLIQTVVGDAINIASYYYRNNSVSIYHEIESGKSDEFMERSTLYRSLSGTTLYTKSTYITRSCKFVLDENGKFTTPSAIKVVTSASRNWGRIFGAAFGTNVFVIPIEDYDEELIETLGKISGKFMSVVIVSKGDVIGLYRDVAAGGGTGGTLPTRIMGKERREIVRKIDVKTPRHIRKEAVQRVREERQKALLDIVEEATVTTTEETTQEERKVKKIPPKTQEPLKSLGIYDRWLPEFLRVSNNLIQWANNMQWDKIESTHNFIQIVFPTKDASQFANKWVVLSDSDVTRIKANEEVQQKFIDVFGAMMRFYGFIYADGAIANYSEEDLEALGDTIESVNDRILTYFVAGGAGGHNYRRMTRILEWATIFGFDDIRRLLVDTLALIEDAPERSKEIWANYSF